MSAAQGFVSPIATPQGSPSKQQFPPGAHDLPSVFENKLKLAPTAGNPNKTPKEPGSPTKGFAVPGSPNKENAPPGARQPKDYQHTSQAAASRQELYRPRGQDGSNKLLPRGLTQEAYEKLQKPSVKRLANVTQLCMCPLSPALLNLLISHSDFLDHYFDLLSYVHNRQGRLAQFKAQHPAQAGADDQEYQAALKQYLGRERAHLRKRRTRLRYGDFQILTQVGQGGYGQVYLAKKKDTHEVCALKVMSKKLLFKMDEIRHILTERDILTNAKSEWLVRLLYAFQDDRSIYLAMVSLSTLRNQ